MDSNTNHVNSLDFADKICNKIKVKSDKIMKKLDDLAKGDDKDVAMNKAMLDLKIYSTIVIEIRKISTKYAHL